MTTRVDLPALAESQDGPPTPSLVTRVALPPGSAGQHSVKLARSVHSGRIARALSEAIVDGALPAGTPLVENQLAADLAVSRGPVRSALHVLQGEGLVDTLPNGRMVTVRFGPEISGICCDPSRARVFGRPTRNGASGGCRSDLGGLRCDPAEGASTEHLVELDVEFHRRLVEFGGSRFLLSAWLALAPVIQAVITIGNRRLAQGGPGFELSADPRGARARPRPALPLRGRGGGRGSRRAVLDHPGPVPTESPESGSR